VKTKESLIRISIICTLGCFMAGFVYGTIRAEDERRRIAENLKRTFSQPVDYGCVLNSPPVVSPISDGPGR
jgi:hypothetical protein